MRRMERLRLIFALIWNSRWLFVVTGVLFLGLGELWMRMPGWDHRLEYVPDDVFGAQLAPDQRGFVWLARLSYQSPSITLNSAGWRGPAVDWSKRVVVALGSSDSLGIGVTDSEVWTARLGASLGAEFQVQNASHPGHGPQKHALRLRRILALGKPELVLIRVSMQDRYFRPEPENSLAAGRVGAERRQKIRALTRFLPYLVNKLQAQRKSIIMATKPRWLRKEPRAAIAGGRLCGDGERMWRDNETWWREAARRGRDAGAPVVFLLYGPVGSASSRVLANHLRTLAAEHSTNHLIILGPAAFGLDKIADEDTRAKTLRATLVLRRDPHANAAQHRLIAIATTSRLRELGLLR